MSRRKKSPNLIPWQIRFLFWLLVAISVLLLVVIPAITNFYAGRQGGIPLKLLPMLQSVETAQKWLLRSFTIGWVFFLGGCFASFLNVVAWRLPRGRGILGSSKCPFCNTRLAFWANMPVIGWLSSGGRCRTCRLPISPRYLFVEITLGLIFVLIVGVELFCGGVNLPNRPSDAQWGIERLVFSPQIDLIQIVAYHLMLTCLIFVISLVRLERKKVPASIFVFGLVVGIGFQCLWPWTQLTSWPEPVWAMDLARNEFWITLGFQLVVGAGCGLLVSRSYRNRETETGDTVRECVFAGTLIGLFLGYPFVLSICLLLLGIDALTAILGMQNGCLFRCSPVFKFGAFALVLLLLWNVTSQFEFWPGPYSSRQTLLVCLSISILLAILNSLIALPKPPKLPNSSSL